MTGLALDHGFAWRRPAEKHLDFSENLVGSGPLDFA
jgi:hypothetical protein